MYGIAASLLASQGGGWPIGPGVYTITEHLLYQIIQLWIYEKSKNAGMLDPNAELFYPQTGHHPSVINNIEKREDTNKSAQPKESDILNTENIITITNTELRDQNNWKIVQNKPLQKKNDKQKIIKPQCKQAEEINKSSNRNRYAPLEDTNELVESNRDEVKEGMEEEKETNVKRTDKCKIRESTYNIEYMTMEAVD